MSSSHWHSLCDESPILCRQGASVRSRLFQAAGAFIDVRNWYLGDDWQPAADLLEHIQWRIAAEASFMVLERDASLFDEVVTIIVYPGAYAAHDVWVDEYGIEHAGIEERAGEAWEQGPVVLAWDAIAESEPGSSLVVHEFAHRLDALNGAMNGFPPLPPDMSPKQWSGAFELAYEELGRRFDAGYDIPLDSYALEAPAEFFAVTCEHFFVEPASLAAALPSLYQLLARYFRHDPEGLLPA